MLGRCDLWSPALTGTEAIAKSPTDWPPTAGADWLNAFVVNSHWLKSSNQDCELRLL